jgi:predicted kinase
MKQPFAVVFAGAPGSSKSIVAHHLSIEFNLPIINRDIIRSEVKEDLLVDSINQPQAKKEFEKRFEERWQAILNAQKPIILDGSIDRSWEKLKVQLETAGYRWLIIDMELPRKFFVKLFIATKRPKAIEQLDGYLEDHRKFMKRYGSEVDIKIDDNLFPRRLEVTTSALKEFLTAKD